MEFFRGLTIAAMISLTFWGSAIYYAYQRGFQAGADAEKDTAIAAQVAFDNAKNKLLQCNELITRNCGKGPNDL